MLLPFFTDSLLSRHSYPVVKLASSFLLVQPIFIISEIPESNIIFSHKSFFRNICRFTTSNFMQGNLRTYNLSLKFYQANMASEEETL